MNKPTYYTVLPAHVRYNKEIGANEKILYSEISTLAQKSGYCFASNDHLAQLMDTSPRTIRRWLESLKQNKLINIQYEIKDKHVNQRRIFVVLRGEDKNDRGGGRECPGGEDESVRYNNTRVNKRGSSSFREIILGDVI